MRSVTTAAATVALLALAVMPALAQTGGSAWQPVASTTAGSRAYASAVALDNSGGLLVVGGMPADAGAGMYPPASPLSNGVPVHGDVPYSVNGQVLRDAWRSRDAGLTWQPLPSYAPPQSFAPRMLHAAVANGDPSASPVWADTVFLYGGLGAGNPPPLLADTWTITSDCVAWYQIDSAAAPGPRAGHALLSFPQRVPRIGSGAPTGLFYLLIAGADSLTTTTADVWKYVGSWTRVNDGSASFGPRTGHGAAVINGLPYVMGGVNGGVAFTDVWRGTDSIGSGWVLVAANAGFTSGGYGVSVTGIALQCVMSGTGGAWSPAAVTVQAGGQNGWWSNGPGSIAVSTNTTAAPLSTAEWHNGVANFGADSTSGMTGTAGAYTAGTFVSVGGFMWPSSPMVQPGRSSVLRLTRSAYASLLPSLTPSNCPAGTFGCGNSCTSCPAGTYSTSGATACTACAAGTVAPSAGSASCMICPEGAVASADRTECVIGDTFEPLPGTGSVATGAIAGIVVGGVVGVALLCVAIRCCTRKPNAGAGVAAAASAGGAAGLSSAPAGAAVVVVVPGAGTGTGTGAAAAKSPRAPQYAPQLSYGAASADGRVVVVRTNGDASANANVTSWKSLF